MKNFALTIISVGLIFTLSSSAFAKEASLDQTMKWICDKINNIKTDETYYDSFYGKTVYKRVYSDANYNSNTGILSYRDNFYNPSYYITNVITDYTVNIADIKAVLNSVSDENDNILIFLSDTNSGTINNNYNNYAQIVIPTVELTARMKKALDHAVKLAKEEPPTTSGKEIF